MSKPNMQVIALTGGPCGGKSSLLERLHDVGALAGCSLFFVPEAATILINEGHDPADHASFQHAVLGLQLKLEGEALARARWSESPAVIVCDRGTMDGAAYCTADQFANIAASYGRSRNELLSRYDMVVHLVSAAVDAPEAYTTGNNEARFEDLAGAIEQEHKTLAVWSDHPNRLVLGGFDSFAQKLEAAVAAMASFLRKSTRRRGLS